MDKSEIARWNTAAELLHEILELPPEQRQAAIDSMGKQHGVARELALLHSGNEATSLLDDTLGNVLEALPDPAPAPDALKGQVLGQWKLDEEVGRGGMSVVYHAHRVGQDFEQSAAVKILSVGHLGENFVAGFLRERQILSDLQHPGIARLIDGGLTPDGAPFLVMQHVEGQQVDQWCDSRQAEPGMIVRLMLKLCHAVTYAHRHLVIHQDIKPANILVDEHDQPILIDFGIARLLSASGESTALRAFSPHYAAPEQLAGDTVTTATDVYALGMLLRKLLEEKHGDRDLEAILDLATHPDPEHRYPNARSFSDDLRAWLDKRPVTAQAPTLGYRTGRFVARNRWGVAAVATIALALVAGLGIALWQAQIAAKERDIARAESVRATQAIEFLTELFRASDPDRSRGEVITARELLDQGAHQVRNAMQETPALQAEMYVLLGDLYLELGEIEAAGPLLEDGLALADASASMDLRVQARRALALHRMEIGEHEEALHVAEQAESLLREQGRVPSAQHGTLMQPILFSLAELGRVSEAVERGEALLARVRATAGLDDSARYNYLYSIGNVILIAEQREEALALLLEATELAPRINLAPSSQLNLQSNLGGILDRIGDLQGALRHRREVMAIADEIYPPVHPVRARMLSNLATTMNALGEYDEAERLLRESLKIYEDIYGEDPHPRVAAAQNNLAQALERAGNPAAAEPHMSRAWEMAGTLFGKNDPRFVIATGNLGNLYRQLGEWALADQLINESNESRRALLGETHPVYGTGLGILAALRLDQGKWEPALALCNEALSIFDQAARPNPRAVLACQTRRARALAGLGQHEEARKQFESLLLSAEPRAKDLGQQWLDLLAAYAQFLAARSDPLAGDAAQRALEAHKSLLGAAHPSLDALRELASGP